MRDDLIEANRHTDANISIDESTLFNVKVRQFQKMVSEIDDVTKKLQTHGHTLANCRRDLNGLMESVENNCSNPIAALYGCKICTVDIGPLTAFEAGVVGQEKELTRAEK
eukprot:IDg3274t1